MSDKIWEDIYNRLKGHWWGGGLILISTLFVFAFLFWNSLPDKTKDKIISLIVDNFDDKQNDSSGFNKSKDFNILTIPDTSVVAKDSKAKINPPRDWLKQLLFNPILPGKSIAGLNIGDSAFIIESKLGIPTHDTEYMRVKINGVEGEIHGYRTQYIKKGVFFGIFSSKIGNQIESFRLYDSNFDKNKIMPNYNGVTIGTSRKTLLKKLGKPKNINHSSGCALMIDSDVMTYVYDGISFQVCSHNDLIWLMDIMR